MDAFSHLDNKTLTAFCGGKTVIWKVINTSTIVGSAIAQVDSIDIVHANRAHENMDDSTWILRGISSNIRYTTRAEKNVLNQHPSVLGKPEATYAALIPIKKSEEWWMMTQDERRSLVEEQSKHISVGSNYLINISRKLYHSRDIGEAFDFLTWFEFAPAYESEFNELVDFLRNSKEWGHVTREIDIRLMRTS